MDSLIGKLIDAVMQKDTASVKALLAQGVDLNSYEDDAMITPLHFAAQNNAIDIAEILVVGGADVHAKTSPEGHTPLDVALINNNYQMADLLRRHMDGGKLH